MVYEYTKPRAPVMAMFNSPGPCYALPGLVGTLQGSETADEKQASHYKKLQHRHDPRSVHIKGPAYSFGLKHGQFQDQCSPGPSLYGPKICTDAKKMFHTGPDGTPQYSMAFRPHSVQLPRMPGPADYKKENCGDRVFPRAPAYTIRERTLTRLTDNTPAPNMYEADSMLGRTVRAGKVRAPTYVMEGRSAELTWLGIPGPSDYQVVSSAVYKTKAPVYTMPGRNFTGSPEMHHVGPASHYHEKLNLTKKQAPKFSFGLRHSQYEAPLIVDVAD